MSKIITFRVNDEEERILMSKVGTNSVSSYIKNLLFPSVGEPTKTMPIDVIQNEKPRNTFTPILTKDEDYKAPFPYYGWTIIPNPENGKIEPVYVDDGRYEAVEIRSPDGRNSLLIRENEPLYEEVWDKLFHNK